MVDFVAADLVDFVTADMVDFVSAGFAGFEARNSGTHMARARTASWSIVWVIEFPPAGKGVGHSRARE